MLQRTPFLVCLLSSPSRLLSVWKILLRHKWRSLNRSFFNRFLRVWCSGLLSTACAPLTCDTDTAPPRPFVRHRYKRRFFIPSMIVVTPELEPLSGSSISATSGPESAQTSADGPSTCLPCQRAKITRHTRVPLQAFLAPDHRFGHVHLDKMSPLLPSRGFR